MKLPEYNRTELPGAQGDAAPALGAEWSRPMAIPGRNAAYGYNRLAAATQNLGERFQQAEDVEDYSAAIVKAHKGMADIQDRINQDPEISAMDREGHEKWFNERSAELKDAVLEGMKSPRAKDKVTAAYANLETQNLVHVRGVARQRFVDRARASTEGELNELSNLMIRTGDLTLYATMEGIVHGKVETGVFSAQEGEQLVDKWRDKSIAGYWDRKIEEAPQTVYAILKEQNPESFKALDEDTKTKLLLKAKGASEAHARDGMYTSSYQTLYNKYGENYERALADANNPNKWKELGLEGPQAAAVSATLSTRFQGMISMRDHRDASSEKRLAEQRRVNTGNVLADFYSGAPLDFGKVDGMMRAGLIDKDVYEHVRKGDAVGPQKSDPLALAPIAEDLEAGKDIRPLLDRAMLEKKISGADYVSYVKQAADRDFKEGLSIVNKTMQPSDMDFNHDKRIAWGEAVGLYNQHVRDGYFPRVAAEMVLDRYKKASRRTLQGLPRPKVLEGAALDLSSLDAAAGATTERFQRGEMGAEAYRFEMNNIEAIKRALVGAERLNDTKTAPDAVQKQAEASKKAAR